MVGASFHEGDHRDHTFFSSEEKFFNSQKENYIHA